MLCLPQCHFGVAVFQLYCKKRSSCFIRLEKEFCISKMSSMCQELLSTFVHIYSCHCLIIFTETCIIVITSEIKKLRLWEIIYFTQSIWPVNKGLIHAWTSTFFILQAAYNLPPSFLHFAGRIPPSSFSLYFSCKLSQWQHIRETLGLLFLLLQLPEKFCVLPLTLLEW